MGCKTVWIINHYAQEPGGSGSSRHFALAKHMRNQGWNTVIIGSSVELNTGRQRLRRGESARLDRYDDIPMLWLKVPEYRGNGFGRIRNMLEFTLRLVGTRTTRELPFPDVVVGSSVHPFAAWAGAVLARRHRVPFVFEVRDLWPETLIDLGRIRRGSLLARCLGALEKWLYRRADRIVVLLPYADKYIVPLGIGPNKIVWIPNGVDLSGFSCTLPPENEFFRFMYFGAHGTANALENIIHAMATPEVRSYGNKIRLSMIGEGPLKQALKELARELEVDNVDFCDPVPKADIPDLAGSANALIFNLIDAPVFKYGISSNKLFDYMAAGRPIIFCCNAANNPVKDAGAGLSIPAGDPRRLAKAMIEVVEMSDEERLDAGVRAREYVVNNHSYESLAVRMAGLLDELT